MRRRILFVFLATMSVVNFSYAGGMGNIGCTPRPAKGLRFVSAVSGGPAWVSAGETQTINLGSQIVKTYVAKNSINTLFAGELFVGAQQQFNKQWIGQFGLAIAAAGNSRLQGVIWDDADSEFENYSYSYQLQHTRIAIKGKLLLNRKNSWLMPWVSGSAGVSFNKAADYSSTPLIYEAVPTPPFTDNAETGLTYSLGIGFQKAFNQHWQAGIGYEFSNWGKSELGRASGQTLNTGLTLDHFYTNGIMFNITYIA